MATSIEPIVIHAETLHGGDVLLTFSDATCVIYSTALLRSIIPQAEQFFDEELGARLTSNVFGNTDPNWSQ
jgi:flavorubredoxin